jgi:hypothetical protein
VRSRIFRWYGQLRDIENRMDGARGQAAPMQALGEELGSLERRAEKTSVPLSYASELYALRGNIGLVRQKLQRQRTAPDSAKPAPPAPGA